MDSTNTSQPTDSLDGLIPLQPENRFPRLEGRGSLIFAQNKKVGVGGYIFWGLSIPPFTTIWSMYSASKKGVLHILIPTMTIVYTILFAAFSFSIFYAPKAFSDVAALRFQTQVDIVSIPSWIMTATVVLTLAGLFGGWYLRSVAKKQGSLSKILMGFLLVILILQFFVEFRELVFINTIISKSIGDIYPGL